MEKMQFLESDDLIDIRYDNVFKAVFARNTPASQGALSSLISALVGRELLVTEISANEPPIDDLRDRQIRFDIFCKSANDELVNIEMSLNPDPFEPVRLEFYAGKLFTRQDIRGSNRGYGDLKEAYQITILSKERFFPDENFLHTFEYYDPVNKVTLNGKSRIITLELSKLDNVIEKPAVEMNVQEYWAVFFRYLTDKSKRRKINEILDCEEGIAMAGKVLINISKDEVEWARLMSEYKYQLDTQSKLVYAEREGLKRGMERGLQKGMQKGMQIGEQKIIDLLKSGKSPEEIIGEYAGK